MATTFPPRCQVRLSVLLHELMFDQAPGLQSVADCCILKLADGGKSEHYQDCPHMDLGGSSAFLRPNLGLECSR